MEKRELAVWIAQEFCRLLFCQRDAEALGAYLSERAVFLGTEENERANGKAEVLEYFREDCREEPEPFQLEITDTRVQEFEGETFAVFVEIKIINQYYSWRLRASMFIGAENGTLCICQLHVSESSDKQLQGEHYPRTLVMENLRQQREELLNDAVLGGMMGGYIEPGFPFYFINKWMTNYLGYDSQEDFVQDNKGLISNCMHPDDRAHVDRKVEEDLAAGNQYAVEYRMRKKNGEYIWVHDIGRRVIAENGKPAIISVCVDVTAVRQAQFERNRLFNTIPGAVLRCRYQKNLEVLEANDGLFNIIGYSREEFRAMGRCMASLIEPADAETLFSDFQRQLETGGGIYAEFRLIRRDGDAVWTAMRANLSEEKDGQVLFCVLTDISEHVEEKQRLRQRYQEELDYATRLVANNLISKSVGNLADDTMETFSGDSMKNAHYYLSSSIDDVIDKMAGTAAVAEDGERFRAMFSRDRLIEDYDRGKTEHSIEFRRCMDGGKIIWCRMLGRTYRNPETNQLALFLYGFDITQEMLSKQLLAQASAMGYDFLMDLDIAHGTFHLTTRRSDMDWLPESGDFQTENEKWAREFVVEAFREEYLQASDTCNMRQELRESETASFTVAVRERGQLRYKKFSYSYIDEIMSRICLSRTDITDIIQQEQHQREALLTAMKAAEQASVAKSDFLSHMSHEIRTPLNAIIGMTTVAQDSLGSREETRDYLKKIGDSSRFLLMLINNILDMSRIESGKMLLKNEPFSLQWLISSISAIIAPQAETKGVAFRCVVAPTLKDGFLGDGMRLQQVLVNILSNAVKFTPKDGHVTFTIEQAYRSDHSATLRFTVADTGIGISRKFLPNLFDPFVQESVGTTAVYGGTGLGLSISKNIMDLMGGHITVNSVQGAGSTFVVDVRLETQAGGTKEDCIAAKAETQAPAEHHGYDFTGRRVLLVEDHPLNTEIAVKLLRRVGFAVDTAGNGLQAVEKFSLSAPGYYDAVLMDIRMPLMDGLTATQNIRRLKNSDAQTVPIIAMTANAFEDDVEKSLQAGMNAHLAKPIESKDLYRTIFEHICGEEGSE